MYNACSHDQLWGASESGLEIQRCWVKTFLQVAGYPTLSGLSTFFPTGQVNTIGVVLVCLFLVYKRTQLDGLHMYIPLIIDYMALIGCMLSVHVAGYG